MLPRSHVSQCFGAHCEGSVDLERRSLRPTCQRTELEELLEPFHRLSISSSEILIPVADPRDISEPHSSDSDLSLDEIFQSPESPAFHPAFPGGFNLDEPFDPPSKCQELLPLSELTPSSPLPSSDSELATEQLLLPSYSLIANSTITLSTQIPIQNTLALTLSNSAPIIPRIPIQIATPPRIMSGAKDMPLRGSNKAPKSSRCTEDITCYLEDVEQLCLNNGLVSGKDKIHWVICYADHNEAEFWSTLDAATNSFNDWDTFSKELLNYYPGASVKDCHYTKADLKTLLYHQVQKPMELLEDLGKYKKKKLPEDYTNEKFLEGFPPRFRNSLLTQLQLSDLDHDINEPWKFDTVYKHANYLLSGAKQNLPQPDSSALFPQNSTPPSSLAVPTILKQEYVHVTQQPVSTPPPQQGQEGQFHCSVDPRCFFCGGTDGHRTAEYALCHKYIQAGKCSLIGGRVFMPDGSDIPRTAAGHNFKEKINNFLTMRDSIIASANLISVQQPGQQSTSSHGHDTPPHLVSTMFFSNEDASEYQVDLHPSSYLVDENLEEEADKEDQHALARAYAQVEELKNAIKKKMTAHFNGVEVPVHRQKPALAVPALANTPVPPIPVSNSTPANPTSSSEPPTAGKSPVAPNLTDLWKLKPSTNSTPQFCYQSSFDEAAATKQIVNQVLDTKMEISTKDLLAVSPEIRKQIRELAVTKKITIGSLETASDMTPLAAWASYEQFCIRDTEGKCMGLAMAPLCAVDGILMDKLHVECILDSGCQVVALRWELWEALEAPLHTDMTMTLEAAVRNPHSLDA
ncbi:hypothetical protein M404DRAFT_34371 [Pisolithus tinctorius Marx 270]|uniref:DUF4100 domain-containing protein n=1 Tax=Pisolithus tinctorius Marx 270 TaxID=870435 RepID=A0A0C3NHJ2_PISTI|nr:hypothetical protein M404DRAFT_34371 [Pisolithus tinctorius Marx 270]